MNDNIKKLIFYFVVGLITILSFFFFLLGLHPLYCQSYHIVNQNFYEEGVLYIDSLDRVGGGYRGSSHYRVYGKINKEIDITYACYDKSQISPANEISLWFIQRRNRIVSVLYRKPSEVSFKDKIPKIFKGAKKIFFLLEFPFIIVLFCFYLRKKLKRHKHN